MRCPKCGGFISTRTEIIPETIIRLQVIACSGCGNRLAEREINAGRRQIDVSSMVATGVKRPCKVDGCDRAPSVRGMCSNHANIILRLKTKYAGRVEFAAGQSVVLLDDIRLLSGPVRENTPATVIGVRRSKARGGVDLFLVETSEPPLFFEVPADGLLSADPPGSPRLMIGHDKNDHEKIRQQGPRYKSARVLVPAGQ
jgi:hypothetical protein